MSEIDLASAYRGARERITEIVRAAGGNAVADQPVPATPEWTVQNVVAHLRGVVQDGLSGNMQGAPGPVWTAAQVARANGKSVELLLEEWADDGPDIEAALASANGQLFTALIMDIHAHEQDLRGALGAPGARTGAFYDWCAPQLAHVVRAQAAAAELPTVRVEVDGVVVGDDSDPVGLSASQWELFRAILGRRSAAQIAALPWTGTGEPEAYATEIVVFGPAVHDVVE